MEVELVPHYFHADIVRTTSLEVATFSSQTAFFYQLSWQALLFGEAPTE
jgi:hypothetical protein